MLTCFRYKIFKFCISLFMCGCFVIATHAQENDENGMAMDSIVSKIPFLTGLRVEADVSPVVGFISGSDIYQYEAAVQFYIRNRYYPVFEMGVSGADRISNSGIRYYGNGTFQRVGIDFNMLRPKEGSKPTNNMLLVGARLGFSNFDYRLENIYISDPYWKTDETRTVIMNNQSKVWFEIVAGIRVEIVKNVFIGWNFRFRNLFGYDEPGNYKPLHVPGYGLNTEGVWGFNYILGYKF